MKHHVDDLLFVGFKAFYKVTEVAQMTLVKNIALSNNILITL